VTKDALPPLVGQLAERLLADFCEFRVPAEVRDKVRLEYEVSGRVVTLWECRPYWRDASQPWTRSAVARMRFNSKDHDWALFWADRNTHWLPYEPLPSAKKLEDLIKAIDRDQTGVFWG
jgi:hypothetical protein